MTSVETIIKWLRDQEFSERSYEDLATDLAGRLGLDRQRSIANVTSAKAAAHPLRHAILERAWIDGEVSPKKASEVIGKPIGNVAYHMRMLVYYKVIEKTRDVPVRGAVEHYYRVSEEGKKLCHDLFGPRPSS